MSTKEEKKTKIIYYEDELNDEFSEVIIKPRVIDEKYKYKRSSIWEFFSFLMQNILTVPFKLLYLKIKFHHKFIGKEKIRDYRKTNKKKGLFIYVNHTQPFADTFLPSVGVFPKRNFIIVNPENVSMKGIGWFVELNGAIPIPSNIATYKNFLERIESRINKGYAVTIYPEAHIWPYATKIRNFKSVSFRYPAMYNVPMFTITNTYQKYKKDKVRIISYIDGPFYPKSELTKKDAELDLRNKAYEIMVKESNNSNIEIIKYVKK